MPLLTELRRLRREAGIKPGAFAASVQCSRSHYMNVEAGSAEASIELSHRIAKGLGVDVGDLTGRQDSTRPDTTRPEPTSPPHAPAPRRDPRDPDPLDRVDEDRAGAA